ncbi:MAG: protein adenylyltransferase SelO [Thioalkalivibrionaceae bacterium]
MTKATGRWRNDYVTLDKRLFARVAPTPVRHPQITVFNIPLAETLGLQPPVDVGTAAGTTADRAPSSDNRKSCAQPAENTDPSARARWDEIIAAWAPVLAGNTSISGLQPLSQAYAGHQYGNFTMLGDGRAHLIGEWQRSDGRIVDIQLKGSGPTPFSRRGDGRATLSAMLREYVISESLAALGLATTRALAVTTTGETVWRERGQPGAILTRIAASHLRVGTFEYAAAVDRQNATEPAAGQLPDTPLTRQLADFAIQRHDPDLAALAPALRYRALLDRVIARQARLVADWMATGFVHGVMNTDNTTISGETIDFGPCAFLDDYRPEQTFSSIDVNGRYAYANQPFVLHWNLARFAETLLPLLDTDAEQAMARAHEALERFPAQYAARLKHRLHAKLALDLVAQPQGSASLDRNITGLRDVTNPLSTLNSTQADTSRPIDLSHDDDGLIASFLDAMARDRADFTLSFRQLSPEPANQASATPANPFSADTHLAQWWPRWWSRVEKLDRAVLASALNTRNPARIARNHVVQHALDAAEHNDLEPFFSLLDAIRQPFETRPQWHRFDARPKPDEYITQTFCGT